MTSKEALEKFKLLYENKCQEQPKNLIGFDMCYIAIKQELERKEELENENKELRSKNFDLSINNVHLRNEIFYLKDKYQTAIEILKEKFVNIQLLIETNCYDEYCMYVIEYVIDNQLTEQEYELLKGVLE